MIKKKGVFSHPYSQHQQQPLSPLKTYSHRKNKPSHQQQQLTDDNQCLKQKLLKLKRLFDQKKNQYQQSIHQIKQQLTIQQDKIIKYQEAIKSSIMWLIEAFAHLNHHHQHQNFKQYLVKAFSSLSQYLEPLGIENKINSLVHQGSQMVQLIDFGSKDITLEMLNLTSLNSLQETFNHNKPNHNQISSELLAQKLFQTKIPTIQPSKICKKQVSEQQSTKSDITLGRAKVSWTAQMENYLSVKEGDEVNLLRKVGDKLWIGEVGDKIGYIQQGILDIMIH